MSTISASTTSTTAYKVTADTTGTLVLQTGSTPTTAMTIDTSQNVGIGTSSPVGKLSISNAGAAGFEFFTAYIDGGVGTYFQSYNRSGAAYTNTAYNAAQHAFYISGTESARIDSNGNLLVGTTTTSSISGWGILKGIALSSDYSANGAFTINSTSASGSQYYFGFGRGGSLCGAISSTGTNSTTFSTSSDYRLKENIAPMTGALSVVQQLKPCTYTWKSTGESTQGFIAHELQEVVPECVVGEKDAVNEDGSIRAQGIDTSFLVAILTAAIQELKAELDAAKADIATLKGAA